MNSAVSWEADEESQSYGNGEFVKHFTFTKNSLHSHPAVRLEVCVIGRSAQSIIHTKGGIHSAGQLNRNLNAINTGPLLKKIARPARNVQHCHSKSWKSASSEAFFNCVFAASTLGRYSLHLQSLCSRQAFTVLPFVIETWQVLHTCKKLCAIFFFCAVAEDDEELCRKLL